ncbi:hypothetical protein DMN91_006445 [Ooceraea biroi]|uniref:Fibronectin type-III domain-containing protein n=2 Tax=Ooceraea biroi TaxID=2015173 RepID=A0A3L8DNP2_OOCBI|nr:hypothetical protein DMN91_006445 [Ooceraea biroi]
MQNTTSVWPNVTCQKLFYDEYTVVSALSDTKLNVKLNTPECPEGRIGPRCLEVCKRNNDGNNDCNGTAICYKDGCTCSPGFMGPDCFEPCKRNTYGYDCKKPCGACMLTEREQSTSLCNTITGICSYGCKNNPEKLYISPLCQEVIDKPREPTIRFINTTNIEIEAPITWKDEYEKSLSYAFIIKEIAGINAIERKWNPIFRNMTKLKLFLQNLKPGTIYHIAYELRLCSQYGSCRDIQSEWKIVEIHCTPSEDFELIIENQSLLIHARHSNLPHSCPPNWYKLMIQHAGTNEHILKTLITKFPYEVTLLPSYATITITILHEDKKIFTKEIRTFKEVPSKILNLRILFISTTSVTLTWMVPQLPSEKIEWYNITLQVKEYRGCKNSKFTLNNPSTTHLTNDTTITIEKLHPYASYSAQVVAYNSQYGSAPVETIFATEQSDTATEVFSHVNVQDWNMTWEPPEDCRTITGSLYARIYVRGVSDAHKDFYIMKQTAHNRLSLKEIKLYNAEIYVATLYVVRHPKGLENPSANQEYVFETPPGAPPRVINLEIYEIDNSPNHSIVYLRWQRPLPPHNGILRIYQVRSCGVTKCASTEVQLNAMCDLWDNYICGSIETYDNNQTIEVVAYNVNVPEPGTSSKVSMTNLHNAIPDEPGEFTVTIHKNSVVDLHWHHPWKTGNSLEYFNIRIYSVSTNLMEEDGFMKNRDSLNNEKFLVINYSRNYTKQLNLLPSTQYLASIQAVTYSDRKSKVVYKLFETPSTLTFSGQLKYKLYETPPSISVHIPSVLYNIKTSMIYIIVKGPQDFKLCEGYSKVPKNLQAQVGVNVNDIAWIAAELPTNKIAGKSFVVGDGEFYGNAKNCPLEFNLLYEITVIVTESNQKLLNKPIMLKLSISIDELSSTHYEKWLVPVIVIVGIAIAFYFYRKYRSRKKERVIRQKADTHNYNMPKNDYRLMTMAECAYEEIREPNKLVTSNVE